LLKERDAVAAVTRGHVRSTIVSAFEIAPIQLLINCPTEGITRGITIRIPARTLTCALAFDGTGHHERGGSFKVATRVRIPLGVLSRRSSLYVVSERRNVGITGAMRTLDMRANTPEHVADQAMGVELMAIEVEEQLEWAEAQGRDGDVAALKAQLTDLHGQLADIAETLPSAA
jgi:hypothetical protein